MTDTSELYTERRYRF